MAKEGYYMYTFVQCMYMYTFLNSLASVERGYSVNLVTKEVLGTMKITLLYQVSHYIRVKLEKFDCAQSTSMPPPTRILNYCSNSLI